MIIKYRSIDGGWNWFSRVDEVKSLGYMAVNDIPRDDEINFLGIKEDGMDPYVLHVCRNGHGKMLAIYAEEAYLTEDTTGNTIDILIPKVRK